MSLLDLALANAGAGLAEWARALGGQAERWMAHIPDARSRRLVTLVMTGESGPYTQTWMLSFRQLATLHLLVVSGTQVECFARSVRRWSLAMLPGAPSGLRWAVAHLHAVVATLVYCTLARWDAPVARAGLCAIICSGCPRLRRDGVNALALVTQCAIFPGHLDKPGFYLSWLSSLILAQAGNAGLSKIRAQMLTTTLCTLILPLLLPHATELGVRILTMAIVANLVLGCLFDRFFVPVILTVLSAAWVESWGLGLGGLLDPLRQMIGFLLDGLARLILVVTQAFRYIR